MRSKSVLDTPRLRELRQKRKIALRKRVIIIIASFLCLFIGMGLLSRMHQFSIQRIIISGNKIVDAQELESFTQDVLGGYYLWLYPKSNVMIYPTRELKREILDKFKRIEHVDMSVDADQNLYLSLRERGASYVWCDTGSKCFFTDEYGYVFDEAPYFSGPVYLKFTGGLDTTHPIIGQNVFSGVFHDIAIFAETISSLGLVATSVDIKSEQEIEISLTEYGDRVARVIFNPTHDLQRMLENLKTALESEPLKGELEKNRPNLVYIDLRFGNKVYYKFQ